MDEKGAKPEDETNKNKKGKGTYDEQKCGSNHKNETLGGDTGDENNTEGNNTMSRTRTSGRKNKQTNLTSI